MKSKAIVILTFICMAILTGCTNAPPKCSDEETFGLIRQIIVNQIGGSEGITDAELIGNMKVDIPRATAFDEKIKKYSCQAKLIVGDAVELPITYESQLDDKDQHLVSVGAISKGDLYVVKAALHQSIAKSREKSVPPPAATPPVTPPSDVTTSSPSIDACVDKHTMAFRKENGEDAMINYDVIEEWKAECKTQKYAKSWKPSFDCNKASTVTEKSICSNNLLGKLDGALSESYKMMIAADIGDGARSELKSTQKSWLNERNKCADATCLIDTYKMRIDAICDYPVISGVHPNCTASSDIE